MDTGPTADADNIKVFCRIRGGSTPRKIVTMVDDAQRVTVNKHSFAFNWVGDRGVSQDEVFNVVGAPLTQSFLSGFNCCIFSYGQTGMCTHPWSADAVQCL